MAGGGALIEHSIHDLDVLAWMAGPVRSLSAHTANFAGHAGIEDVAALTLVHESGVTSTLTSVWHSMLSRPSTRRVEVFCEHGMLWTDAEGAGPLRLQTDDGVGDIPLREGAETASSAEDAAAEVLGLSAELKAALSLYVRSDLAFLDSLAASKAPSPGLEPALAAHRLVDLAYRSAAGSSGSVGSGLATGTTAETRR